MADWKRGAAALDSIIKSARPFREKSDVRKIIDETDNLLGVWEGVIKKPTTCTRCKNDALNQFGMIKMSMMMQVSPESAIEEFKGKLEALRLERMPSPQPIGTTMIVISGILEDGKFGTGILCKACAKRYILQEIPRFVKVKTRLMKRFNGALKRQERRTFFSEHTIICIGWEKRQAIRDRLFDRLREIISRPMFGPFLMRPPARLAVEKEPFRYIAIIKPWATTGFVK